MPGTETAPLLGKRQSDDAGTAPYWVTSASVAAASLGLVCFGQVIGYTSPCAAQLSPPSGGGILSPPLLSLFEAISTLGAIAGAAAAGPLLDALGRARALSCACAPFVLGWLLIALGRGAPPLLAGRFLTGAGVGVSLASVGVYIAEVSPAGVRGGFLSTNQLAINIGIVATFALGLPALGLGWRGLAALSLASPLALLAASFAMPETPRWLCSKGRRRDALSSIVALRGFTEEEAAAELVEVEAAAAAAAALPPLSLWDVLRAPALSRPLTIVFGLAIFQQATGVNAVFYNASSILASVGVASPDEAALLVMGPQIAVSVAACLLMDRAGRRPLLIGAACGMAAGAALLGICFDGALGPPGSAPRDAAAVAALLIFVSAFSFGMGPIPWMVMTELLPTRERAAVSGATAALNNTAAFAVILSFQALARLMRAGNVFFLYAALCMAAAGFAWALLPETKGLTLEAIQRAFADPAGDSSAVDTSGGGDGSAAALADGSRRDGRKRS